jgi:hypothetical protein
MMELDLYFPGSPVHNHTSLHHDDTDKLNLTTDNLDVANTTVPEEATEFTLFPQLPAEIRLIIWKMNLPSAPKFLDISLAYDPCPNLGVNFIGLPEHVRLKLNAGYHYFTGMLRACKESREVALMALPATLPSEDRDIEIRYSPAKSGIYDPTLNCSPRELAPRDVMTLGYCGSQKFSFCDDIQKSAIDMELCWGNQLLDYNASGN